MPVEILFGLGMGRAVGGAVVLLMVVPVEILFGLGKGRPLLFGLSKGRAVGGAVVLVMLVRAESHSGITSSCRSAVCGMKLDEKPMS
jgi:hypothetical protein